MKTKNAKELASIISLLLSKDYESVQLGISLFLGHYLITNYPKYEKFRVSLKYRGYRAPSEYCRTYADKSEEFNKNQFIKMLSSKSIKINKKVCAIINFIYDNVDSQYIKIKNKRIKNFNHHPMLSSELWDSSLDNFNLDHIHPRIIYIPKKTRTPLSKKELRKYAERRSTSNYLFSSENVYLDYYEDFIEDCVNLNISNRAFTRYSTPWSIIFDYKQYLKKKFERKGRHYIKNIEELENILNGISGSNITSVLDWNKYFVDNLTFVK